VPQSNVYGLLHGIAGKEKQWKSHEEKPEIHFQNK
jgi:hypothetical protein